MSLPLILLFPDRLIDLGPDKSLAPLPHTPVDYNSFKQNNFFRTLRALFWTEHCRVIINRHYFFFFDLDQIGGW